MTKGQNYWCPDVTGSTVVEKEVFDGHGSISDTFLSLKS